MGLDDEKFFELINKDYGLTFEGMESYDHWKDTLNAAEYFGASFLRDQHVNKRCYPIITLETFGELCNLLTDSRVADIGCGSGYLSYHLLKAGIGVIPVDNRSSHYVDSDTPVNKEIVRCDYLEFDIAGIDTFIISWPNHGETRIEAFLERLPENARVIYQGEGFDGCTGTDRFHELLEEDFCLNIKQTYLLNQHHVKFLGSHDRWYVYVKGKA